MRINITRTNLSTQTLNLIDEVVDAMRLPQHMIEPTEMALVGLCELAFTDGRNAIERHDYIVEKTEEEVDTCTEYGWIKPSFNIESELI